MARKLKAISTNHSASGSLFTICLYTPPYSRSNWDESDLLGEVASGILVLRTILTRCWKSTEPDIFFERDSTAKYSRLCVQGGDLFGYFPNWDGQSSFDHDTAQEREFYLVPIAWRDNQGEKFRKRVKDESWIPTRNKEAVVLIVEPISSSTEGEMVEERRFKRVGEMLVDEEDVIDKWIEQHKNDDLRTITLI